MARIRRRKGKRQAQVRGQGHRQLARSIIHRRDAEAWARQAEAELDRAALPVDPRKLKALAFGELLERFAAEVTPGKRGACARGQASGGAGPARQPIERLRPLFTS